MPWFRARVCPRSSPAQLRGGAGHGPAFRAKFLNRRRKVRPRPWRRQPIAGPGRLSDWLGIVALETPKMLSENCRAGGARTGPGGGAIGRAEGEVRSPRSVWGLGEYLGALLSKCNLPCWGSNIVA